MLCAKMVPHRYNKQWYARIVRAHRIRSGEGRAQLSSGNHECGKKIRKLVCCSQPQATSCGFDDQNRTIFF